MSDSEMLKELVRKIDRGYALANLVKDGVVPMPKGWSKDYINGVIGAYQTLEATIHGMLHGEEEG